jgi:hypothetical protein
MNSRILRSSAALLTLGLMLSPLASADIITAAVGGAVPVPVGMLDAQFVSATVENVTGPRSLVISYFAECQVERGHVEYDIVVNRSILAITSRQTSPTHDVLNALCSNDGDTTESNLRAKSVGIVVACSVTRADDYTVKVRGHVEGPGMIGPGLVDDQSLVIEQHAFSPNLPPCVFELPSTSPGG